MPTAADTTYLDNAQNLHQIHQEQQETRREIRQIGKHINPVTALSSALTNLRHEYDHFIIDVHEKCR